MTANVSIVILSAEQLAELTTTMQQLREHAASYDRLHAAHGQMMARANALEATLDRSEELVRSHWQQVKGLRIETEQLKQTLAAKEEENVRIGRKVFALEAMKEGVDLELEAANKHIAQLEAQLAAGDAEKQELRAALVVAKLPAGSRDNVIQMVREAA